jgi:hypothetical protein
MRSADLVLVWVTINRPGDRLSQARRTVAPLILGDVELVDFNKLRVINALSLMAEYVADGQRISGKAIGG